MEKTDKIVLLVLVSLTIITAVIAVYLNISLQNDYKKVRNNNIHVMQIGGKVEENFTEKYMKDQKNIGKYDVHTYEPKVRGANTSIVDWNSIAVDIYSVYESYSAFVIVCDSNTLNYIGYALHFILENNTKPIVLCDGNLAQALKLVSRTTKTGIMTISGGKVFNKLGNKSVSDLENPLGSMLDPVRLNLLNENAKIAVQKIYPGITGIRQQDVHAIILELYNDGTVPHEKKFLSGIQTLVKRGIVVIGVSEKGSIDPILSDIGVVDESSHTTEHVYAKTCHLLTEKMNEEKVIEKVIHI